jgi:hypothetical protein
MYRLLYTQAQLAFGGGKWGDRPRPKVVLMSLPSIPIEIPILLPRAVMVGPRSRVLITPLCIQHLLRLSKQVLEVCRGC